MAIADTSPEVQERFHTMLMALCPADRLRRGCAMFTTAKKLAMAGILAEHDGELDEAELKRELAKRFYGIDFLCEPTSKTLGHRNGR